MPCVTIRLPTALEALAGGRSSVTVEAATVQEALHALRARHPEVGSMIHGPDERVRPHIHLFLGDRQVSGDPAGDVRIGRDEELRIVPSIAGG